MAHQKTLTQTDEQNEEFCRRAARILDRKGFRGISMDELLKELSTVADGIYHHSRKKKTELLYSIKNLGLRMVKARVQDPLDKEDDPTQRLYRLVSAHVRLALEEPSIINILLADDDDLEEEHRGSVKQQKKKYLELVAATIEAALQQQAIRQAISPTLSATAFLLMIGGVARHQRFEIELSAGDIENQLIDITLKGILGARPVQSATCEE